MIEVAPWNEEDEFLEGKVLDAPVLAVGDDHLVVKLDDTAEGRVPFSDFCPPGKENDVSVGDVVPVYVEQKSADADHYLVSRDKAQRIRAFDRVVRCFEAKEPIEGEIVAAIDGGFSVDVGIKAFLPASQFGMRPVRAVDQVLGQKLMFRIIRFNAKRQNVVLSRRVLLEEERDRTLDRIQVGAIIEGAVRSFVDYGAFVDVGGIEGLLHVTDMSWGRVSHPSEILRVGDPVTVKVLKFDKKARRLSLGLRQLHEDPWLEAKKKYQVGAVVQGPVIAKTDVGCFIELEPGVEGLVHSAGKLVDSAARDRLKKVGIGDRLRATVLEADVEKKRISLGLKLDE